MESQPSLFHAERKFLGDELLLARSSGIFVMTRRLGLTNDQCHELAWGLGAAVYLYTCTGVLWLSTGVLCWSSIDLLVALYSMSFLLFGSHRDFMEWPDWVNKVSKIRIIGAIFSNDQDIEKLNTKEVERCTLARVYSSIGIRGTLLQKVYFLNTYIFSKLTYLAQVFILDEEVVRNITRKAHNLLYRGELERQVAAVNFRPKEFESLH